jgi:hypothetical protein
MVRLENQVEGFLHAVVQKFKERRPARRIRNHADGNFNEKIA